MQNLDHGVHHVLRNMTLYDDRLFTLKYLLN